MELSEFKRLFMHPKLAIEYQVTCILIASKLVEIDDNLVQIDMLQKYVAK